MEGSGGVVLGQDGPDQNSFNKVLRRHQNVEAVAAVLDARFKNLSESSYTPSHLRQLHASVRLAHTATAYSQRQHDLLEVPIPHDSLLQSFDRISGPANNRHAYQRTGV